MTDLLDIRGQRVLVVGAASGIGCAVAEFFTERGAFVYGADQNLVKLKAKLGGVLEACLELDVTKDDSVHREIDQLIDKAGRIDALLNCAGVTGQTGVLTHEVDLADFQKVLDVNLGGAFRLTRAILPHMVQNSYGRILHVASMAGKEGNAGMASYSASKAGLIGFVKSVGKEYATSGVTINAIAPAVIHTSMVDAMPSSQVDYMTAKIPMARLGTLEEVTYSALWALSPACSFTTGYTFDLSGGRAVY